jgi:hypothetical protein
VGSISWSQVRDLRWVKRGCVGEGSSGVKPKYFRWERFGWVFAWRTVIVFEFAEEGCGKSLGARFSGFDCGGLDFSG